MGHRSCVIQSGKHSYSSVRESLTFVINGEIEPSRCVAVNSAPFLASLSDTDRLRSRQFNEKVIEVTRSDQLPHGFLQVSVHSKLTWECRRRA